MIEGWQEIKFGQIGSKFFSGGTPSTKESILWNGDIQWITSKWLNGSLYLWNGEKTISVKGLEKSASKLVPRRSIIIATRVGVGKASINEIDIAINQDLLGVEIDEKHYVPEFLVYQIRTQEVQNIINSFKRGATIQGVTRDAITSVKLKIPPLPEQRKIVYVLSLIRKAIEQQEKLIHTTIELKKTLMQKLFTEGIIVEKQKQTEIGLVPESWVVQPFENTGEVVYGIQAAVANNLKPIGHKILTNKNITIDGRFDLEKINYFVLTSKRHFDTILRKGDLLFNWRSGSKEHVGKTAIFDLEDSQYVHSSFILRIRVNENHNAKFLFYYLNYLREIGYYQKVQTFSINAKFNKSAINAMPIALPNRKIQDEIAETISIIDKKIDRANVKYIVQTELFKTLLHELMTGQRRVNEIDFELSGKNYQITEQPVNIAAEI